MKDTIKLFDSNNKVLPDFDQTVEIVLKSIHGDDYYDTDEELINTNMIDTKQINEQYNTTNLEQTIEMVNLLVDKNTKKITLVNEEKQKATTKDFIPVLFFVLLAIIIIFAGYYFLSSFDVSSLIG